MGAELLREGKPGQKRLASKRLGALPCDEAGGRLGARYAPRAVF